MSGLEPVVLASIIGGSSAVAGSIAGKPKTPEAPKPMQPQQQPDTNLLRRRAKQGLTPRGAYGSASGSALAAPSVSGATLLGR